MFFNTTSHNIYSVDVKIIYFESIGAGCWCGNCWILKQLMNDCNIAIKIGMLRQNLLLLLFRWMFQVHSDKKTENTNVLCWCVGGG